PHTQSTGITLATRTLAVRPVDGSLDRPILSSLPDESLRPATSPEPIVATALLASELDQLEHPTTVDAAEQNRMPATLFYATDAAHEEQSRPALSPSRKPSKVS